MSLSKSNLLASTGRIIQHQFLPPRPSADLLHLSSAIPVKKRDWRPPVQAYANRCVAKEEGDLWNDIEGLGFILGKGGYAMLSTEPEADHGERGVSC